MNLKIVYKQISEVFSNCSFQFDDKNKKREKNCVLAKIFVLKTGLKSYPKSLCLSKNYDLKQAVRKGAKY